ncbi:pyruvate kinase [Nematocida displodere]|uniref:Pyruvate kinase n=1 Tax=Nematocida displodere TaxID=1805483 RepID=A0A177EDF0_9MICR|nr:pyruvate kinase [Nematocida displodere]
MKRSGCKIVCTLGPASTTKERIKKMFDEGMCIARVNFSHGDDTTHQSVFDLLNEIRREERYQALGVAVDTKGPEVRTGTFQEGKVLIETGSTVVLTTILAEENACTSERIFIDHSNIYTDLQGVSGASIFIDDGKLELKITSVDPKSQEITTVAKTTATLSSKKGVNIPGVSLSLPALTEKDKKDISFGIRNGADFVFASFIRTASHLEEIRQIPGTEQLKVIAKIESVEGLKNLEEIVEASDGILIARGDLGIETDYASLFATQCSISRLCQAKDKPFIVATQMMESMEHAQRPTRSEITDVGFAYATSAGCVMLSGETANGQDPVNTVRSMARILFSTAETLAKQNLTVSLGGTPQTRKLRILLSNNEKYLRWMQIVFGAISIYSPNLLEAGIPQVPSGYTPEIEKHSIHP